MNQVGVFQFLVFLLIFSFSRSHTPCLTPENRTGICVSIYGCNSLYRVVQKKPLLQSDIDFLRKTQCLDENQRWPVVCCPSKLIGSRIDGTDVEPDASTLPAPPVCGRSSLGDKLLNGNHTSIDEFPWMALLQYEKDGARQFRCGGSLINQRYVITAAHCVTGNEVKYIGKLVAVRLGEYKISSLIDCLDKDCADPVVDVDIQDIIPHEGFTDTDRHHDIALVRLSTDVKYSDFVSPICMPGIIRLPPAQNGEIYVVAGWGKTLNGFNSDVKQRLSIPSANHTECSQKYESKRLKILDSQLCAGGRYQEDTCTGDSGGPLMRTFDSFWGLDGIISYGNQCGVEGWPGVYTKVSSYEEWILKNMKP